MLTEEEKHIALLKPYDLMTNKEFEFVMFFERWASTQKYETIQLIHLTQALEIFEDELFDIYPSHLNFCHLAIPRFHSVGF